jgi:hypothetical protein
VLHNFNNNNNTVNPKINLSPSSKFKSGRQPTVLGETPLFLDRKVLVKTEIFGTVHHLKLKNVKCFGGWMCPHLHAQWEKGRTYCGGPIRKC